MISWKIPFYFLLSPLPPAGALLPPSTSSFPHFRDQLRAQEVLTDIRGFSFEVIWLPAFGRISVAAVTADALPFAHGTFMLKGRKHSFHAEGTSHLGSACTIPLFSTGQGKPPYPRGQ